MPRGKIVARQFLPRSVAAQLPSPRGGWGNFERAKKPLLWRRSNLGEGHCESKIAARQWGVKFCRDVSQGPFNFWEGATFP